jgi:hypothetical protein
MVYSIKLTMFIIIQSGTIKQLQPWMWVLAVNFHARYGWCSTEVDLVDHLFGKFTLRPLTTQIDKPRPNNEQHLFTTYSLTVTWCTYPHLSPSILFLSNTHTHTHTQTTHILSPRHFLPLVPDLLGGEPPGVMLSTTHKSSS